MYRLINIKKALTTVLLLFTLLTAVAQTAGTVTGTVRNEQGETLIGVHAVSYTHLTLPTIYSV